MQPTFLGQSEIFWVGFTSLWSCVTTIVVIFYTAYTRRMMKLGELSRRATLVPVLAVKDDKWDGTLRVVTIQNLTDGPALYLFHWAQTVSKSFALNDMILEGNVPFDGLPRGCLAKNQETSFHFVGLRVQQRCLFVIECTDAAGGRHQLQMLNHAGDNSTMEIQMNHQLELSRLASFIAWMRKIKTAMDRIDGELEH